MDHGKIEVLNDGRSAMDDSSEFAQSNNDVKDIPRSVGSPAENKMQVNTADLKGENVVSENGQETFGEVNMEAYVSPDDVIRAGGFGARDDISSFLPVASDATDFEETILDARNYEEPQEIVRRPGLGWSEEAERK